jgi:NitT/TauT family transport system substrate-binding protein
MAALLSGHSEVMAHFASAPFQDQELENPHAHRVLSSYDVLGGPHTFNVLWTTQKFHDANPRLYAAFLAALERAMVLIRDEPTRAAAIYIDEEKSKLAPEFVEQMIRDPENVFTTTPQKVMKYAEFMHKIGAIDNLPKTSSELFFPEFRTVAGN